MILLGFAVVSGGLLLFALVVFGVEELALFREARSLRRVGLLNRDVGLFRTDGVGSVGVGDVSLRIDRLVDLVGLGAVDDGRKQERLPSRRPPFRWTSLFAVKMAHHTPYVDRSLRQPVGPRGRCRSQIGGRRPVATRV